MKRGMGCMELNPKVSIIIPVYNGENYLKCAIDSALSQTYKNIEVIVVDDGSTDSTEEIALSYGSRIRYHRKSNGGVASAVNCGVRMMQGDYFSWLSHDDFFHPEKIEKQIEELGRHPECRLCFSNINVLYVNENRTVCEDVLEYHTEEQIINSCYAPIFFAIHGSTILVEKSLIEEVGLWDENLKTTQDSVWLFNAMRGRKNAFVKEQMVTVRIHNEMGQITLPEHSEEFNKMVVDFCESLSASERVDLCGSEYKFYAKYFETLYGNKKAVKSMEYLKEKLKRTAKKEYAACFGNNEFKIGIFGMGTYGKIVFDTFENYLISPDCFFDNNPGKKGDLYKGVACMSMEDLRKNKNDYIIIASISNPEPLVEELKREEIPIVVGKDEACTVLYNHLKMF